MKVNHILLSALLLSSMVSCDGNDITPELPDTPEQPTEGYQFIFGGSTDTEEEATRASWTDEITGNEGKRHLVFGWDYTDKSNPTYEMKMAFLDAQGSPLQSKNNKNYSDITILKHSTKANDSHWAEFETVERYANPLKTYDGHTLIAVNGKSSTVQTSPFAMQLAMPKTFTQQAANSLAHLSDYMYMYDTYVLEGGTAHLKFKHLTAPVRFRIHNLRPSAVKIYSASMHVANNQALTSSSVSVGSNGATYGATTHSSITVAAANDEGFSIAERSQNEYIDLYAHVLPLGDGNSLVGKTIQFTIEANDIVTGEKKVQYLTSELDHITADKFYQVTKSYNWIAGDLYTFHIYLDDAIKEITMSSVSIEEWVNEGLDDSETM